MSNAPDQKKALNDQIQLARSRGADCMRIMRMALAQALHAVEDCSDRYNATDDLSLQAEHLNRAMMHVCSDLMPRLRSDTVADAQAALLLADAQKVAA